MASITEELDPLGALLSTSFADLVTAGSMQKLFKRSRVSLRFVSSPQLEKTFVVWRTSAMRGQILTSALFAAVFFLIYGLCDIVVDRVSLHQVPVSSNSIEVDADAVLLLVIGAVMLAVSVLMLTIVRKPSVRRDLVLHNWFLPLAAACNFVCVAVWFILTPQTATRFASPLGVLYFFAVFQILCQAVFALRVFTLLCVFSFQVALLVFSYAIKWWDVGSDVSLFAFYFKSSVIVVLWCWVLVSSRITEMQERSMFLDLLILRLKSSKARQLLSLSPCASLVLTHQSSAKPYCAAPPR
jgi:hypothetical protein